MNNETRLAARVTTLARRIAEIEQQLGLEQQRATDLEDQVRDARHNLQKLSRRHLGTLQTTARLRARLTDSKRNADLWKTRHQRDTTK